MWDVPFLGYGGAIAVVGIWESDRLLEMWESDRFLWMWDVRSLLGCGGAIALGIWEGDRCFGDVGGAIAVVGIWEVAFVGMMGCDRCFGKWEGVGIWEGDRFGEVGVRSLLMM